MSNIDKVNKWAAEACELDTRINNVNELCYRIGKDKKSHFEVWTIDDPRCREIVRDKFKISTTPDIYDNWISRPDDDARLCGVRTTIPEAEIACITALYENE